jgi:hypothetical protein
MYFFHGVDKEKIVVNEDDGELEPIKLLQVHVTAIMGIDETLPRTQLIGQPCQPKRERERGGSSHHTPVM